MKFFDASVKSATPFKSIFGKKWKWVEKAVVLGGYTKCENVLLVNNLIGSLYSMCVYCV